VKMALVFQDYLTIVTKWPKYLRTVKDRIDTTVSG